MGFTHGAGAALARAVVSFSPYFWKLQRLGFAGLVNASLVLTTAARELLSVQGTFFARFGDVSEMTVPQYQSDVVGMGAAAGPGQPVSGFVTAGSGTAGAFGQAGVWNNAGIMEYTNGAPFIPHSYVPLP
ncbi:MAG TPA: hypothetical protein VGM83_02010 [Devosiaceae bacterium]|jgi:hypothetical protein